MMSEFKLSTLIVLLVLLIVIGSYSYWQIYRIKYARRQQKLDTKHDQSMMGVEFETFKTQQRIVTTTLSHKPWVQKNNLMSLHGENTPVIVRGPGSVGEIVPLTFPISYDEGDTFEKEAYSEHDDLQAYQTQNQNVKPHKQNAAFATNQNQSESQPSSKAEIELMQFESVEMEMVPILSTTASEAQASDSAFDPHKLDSTLETETVEQAIETPIQDIPFFSQQDEAEHAAHLVFSPLKRFYAWVEAAHPIGIQSIDGVVNITLSQPKLTSDIERVLDDLRLDTDLPLRLYGRRAGQESGWQGLEPGTLYSALRLTLQLANTTSYADSTLIQNWFVLSQKLTKRLAASVQTWPDPAALASYAIFLHDLAQRLSSPIIVQLRKPSGLWPAYEVHQHMTQWGVALSEQGQYLARSNNGKVLYTVFNDISNPHAQDFFKETLPSMHVNTLSFCLDLARVDQEYQPSAHLWQDMSQMAQGLQAQWCNAQGVVLDAHELMSQAKIQFADYYRQLDLLNIPAGSPMLRRLLRG